ncbi:MAG: CoA transferase [Crenarchaeota archaeon]|nr:CoA transferase [Thermoproteota archaeon]
MFLKGIRVLDFSRVLVGPLASMMLADLGAEVIKIEPPEGDETRYWAPIIDGESGYFMSFNRNKKSIAIDLKKNKGREIVYKLIKISDVVIENFREGVPEKLGIDYKTLKEIKPDIIYCSIRGFGSGSPYESRPLYDVLVQAKSGLMDLHTIDNNPPIRVAFALFDVIAGLIASNAILSALVSRSLTREGAHIEVSLFDSAIFGLSYIAESFLLTGKVPRYRYSEHPSIVPYQAFKCRDGKWIAVAVTHDKFWANFCKALGLEELIDDPRFRTNPDRVKNREILIKILEEKFMLRSRDEWVKILDSYDVPNAPVLSLDEVFKDAHVVSSGIVQEVYHKGLGRKVPLLALPLKIRGERPRIESAPPKLGQDVFEILQMLGYSDEKIRELLEEKVVYYR